MNYEDLPLSDDTELLHAVGAAYADLPPVPTVLSEFARSVIDWAHLEAEVAQMTFDSGLERAAGLRSSQSNERALSYTGTEVEIELTMLIDTAVGQITPPDDYAVTLQTPTGRDETTTDSRGRFRLPKVRLPARLIVSGRVGQVVTPWLTA